ncbi:hypothetical protein F5Y17DRAFT_164127 [Xylariaceae sp. FL0594]|nr:hypothetical protein F5Y17DRAFT_164127 [Xylariaceae sp. FL0594]
MKEFWKIIGGVGKVKTEVGGTKYSGYSSTVVLVPLHSLQVTYSGSLGRAGDVSGGPATADAFKIFTRFNLTSDLLSSLSHTYHSTIQPVQPTLRCFTLGNLAAIKNISRYEFLHVFSRSVLVCLSELETSFKSSIRRSFVRSRAMGRRVDIHTHTHNSHLTASPTVLRFPFSERNVCFFSLRPFRFFLVPNQWPARHVATQAY